MTPLLTFDQFDRLVPELIAEADAARGELHSRARLGEDGVLATVGVAVDKLACLVPYVERPREPGVPYLVRAEQPDGAWETRHGDVRADALGACAQLLEALAAVRSLMSAETAQARGRSSTDAVQRDAFESFSAPGSGLPDPLLEWKEAIVQTGRALTSLFNPRLGDEIGPAGAHDALEHAAGHAFCVLAMIDARLAQRRLYDGTSGGWTLDVALEDVAIPDRAGRRFIIARVPRIERAFASPMHTVAGMPVRLAGWREELRAFLAGQLPSARLREDTSMPSEQADLRAAVVAAIEDGFAASLKIDAAGEVYGYLARTERIAEAIDVDALGADYEAWFDAAGVTDPQLGEEGAGVAEQLAWALEDLRERCYSDYLHSLGDERYGPERIRGAIVDSVVVGDDPAQTCAYLLRDLTGDQRLWESNG